MRPLLLLSIFLPLLIVTSPFSPLPLPTRSLLHQTPSPPSLLHAGRKKGNKAGGYEKSNSYDKRAQQKSSKSSSSTSKTDSLDSQFMFSLMNLSKKVVATDRTVLSKINLSFLPGAKIGVVGSNGSGKSTLLKIMAGLDKDFDGTARPRPGAKIGYLAQEPVLTGATVAECIAPAVAASQALLDEYNDLSLKLGDDMSPNEMEVVMTKFDALQTTIDAQNLWELDRTVERAMSALRCPPDDAVTATLSGGEKRRVALAALLLQNHDLLLLDEPTNHLDADSVAWLETFLDKFTGTLVCITHDRYFLESVAQWILELDRGKGIPHEGNYSRWLEEKARRLTREKQEESSASKALNEELEWIRSTPKAKGNKSKARLSRYSDMVAASAPRELTTHGQIYIPPGPRLGDVVIKADSVNKAWGEKVLLKDASFDFPPGSIVGVVGANGAGKSTMMKMITGDEKADSGSIQIGETVKLVTVGQDRMESLNDDKSAFDEITDGLDEIVLGGSSVSSRAYCSWFGLQGALQQSKIRDLSGGERNRVLLAKMVKSGGNVLLLDEPTNDLDSETIRSLEEALLEFAGCAVIVSHDRYMLDKVCTHILAFEDDSKLHWFQGNWAEYEEDRKKRLGEFTPKRVKYAPIVV